MALQQYKRAVGVFPSRRDAEQALSQLRKSGFSMESVSILAQNIDQGDQIAGAEVRDRGDTEAQEGAGIGAVTGTVLGGFGGLLVGLEALVIPGVGPFLAAGTIATTLAGAGMGAAGGAIVGALTGAGIPEEDAQAYNKEVSQGKYLVILEGYQDSIERADSILKQHGIRNWKVYDVSDNHVDKSNMQVGMNRDSERYNNKRDDETTVDIIDKRGESRI